MKIKDLCAGILMLAAIIVFLFAQSAQDSSAGTEREAEKLERKLTRRISRLESLADKALHDNPAEWMDLGKVPEDMTIYRYVGGQLQSWQGSFSVADDKLDDGSWLPKIVSPEFPSDRTLSDIGDSLGFFSFGPRCYLAKSKTRDDVKVIFGLTVTDRVLSQSFNSLNPRLHVPERFSVKPALSGEGTTVIVGGRPQFCLVPDDTASQTTASPLLMWTSFFLLIISVLLLVFRTESYRKLLFATGVLLLSGAGMWLWGRSVHDNFTLFSPTIYADGELFYSLGATIILNLLISLLCLIRHLSHKALLFKSRLVSILVFSALLVYSFLSLRSIQTNSGICLELYKFGELSVYSWVVFASFLVMFATFPFILDSERIFTRKFRLSYASSIAVAITLLSSALGFHKEQKRMEVWANKLTLDRDITLEMDFKRVENEISSDAIIASLAAVDNGGRSIEKRLASVFFPRLSKQYDFYVVTNPDNLETLTKGEPVTDNSHLLFCPDDNGALEYRALFHYNIPGYGLRSVVIHFQQLSGKRVRGYASLLGIAPPGRTVIPAGYSFARYNGRRMLSWGGNFAYETRMDDRIWKTVYKKKQSVLRSEGYTHFIYLLPEGQSVMISRRTLNFINFIIEATLISMLLFALISIPTLFGKRAQPVRHYYKTRINWVLMSSLLLTLIALAMVSVFFVYDRNESNTAIMLSEKMNSTRARLEDNTHGASSTEDLTFPGMSALLQNVAESSNSDITLFTPDGRMLMSTAAFLFDRQVLGMRIDGEAFDNVVQKSRRLYVHKESLGGLKYYNVYSPLNGSDGRPIAIISNVYAAESYDFQKDAVSHSITVLTVFLLLLLVSRLIASEIVDRMFGPLNEMSRKMGQAGLDSLEPVVYDRDDEIAPLVDAYNRMTAKLTESSRELALAERDKAWSGMARQVAHEIKNPLTPMKLQLQRLIRLKDRNAEDWQEKFDEVSRILLDHIEILSDTANEFSTFAKLYTEEPSEINLNAVLEEEISMFDNKSDVRFEYLGLNGAVVSGPKPQLTRVIVNLLNNAVQALEGQDKALIRVSLRNSITEGFYDIVFEDNGPGVSEDNIPRLFTPNFTTKNGGSGLGLAISRSILERCGASLAYSKSFTLGGACFTIRYPK